jgi:hypothetical protein
MHAAKRLLHQLSIYKNEGVAEEEPESEYGEFIRWAKGEYGIDLRNPDMETGLLTALFGPEPPIESLESVNGEMIQLISDYLSFTRDKKWPAMPDIGEVDKTPARMAVGKAVFRCAYEQHIDWVQASKSIYDSDDYKFVSVGPEGGVKVLEYRRLDELAD